jgi:hypothetical protein
MAGGPLLRELHAQFRVLLENGRARLDLIGFDRFAEIIIHPRGETFGTVSFQGMRRHRDHPGVPGFVLRFGADRASLRNRQVPASGNP